MSVNDTPCDCCGEAVYEEYVASCSKCGHSLCTSCLINDDLDSRYAYEYKVKFDGTKEQKEYYGIHAKGEGTGYGYEIGDIIDDVGIDSKYCPFCSGTEVHNDDLLDFALDKYLNMSKEELTEAYQKSKGGQV